MEQNFALYDVSSEAILNIVKSVASASNELSEEDIIKAMESRYKATYVKQCLSACLQLKLLERINGGYQVTSSHRDEIKRAKKDELIVFFREALQRYPQIMKMILPSMKNTTTTTP